MTEKKQNRWRRLIRKAANILEQNGWIRGELARNKTGKIVDPLNPEACSFCMLGAMNKALGKSVNVWSREHESNPSVYNSAIKRFTQEASDRSFMSAWGLNDHAKSKEEVIQIMREVANG
jgi:hypothetical protein